MVRHDLNVSETALALHTSQPGVSKQIRQLEDELGVELFERAGRQIASVTPAGKQIISIAERVLAGCEDIRDAGRQFADPGAGELRLATTHTQARYVLPSIIEAFGNAWPRVNLHLHQGTPEQMAGMAQSGEVDFVIATEGMHHYQSLVLMPCARWHRAVIVPEGHDLQELAQRNALTLDALSRYSLITYTFGFTGRSILDRAFREAGLEPKVVLTAVDADVIKTYVRTGLGVGLIAAMAFEQDDKKDLVALDASHLFAPSTTHIGMRPRRHLRPYMYDFIERFAAHLTHERVDAALAAPDARARQAVFDDVCLQVS
jgi:LysR family cys regulon transcriptional activator